MPHHLTALPCALLLALSAVPATAASPPSTLPAEAPASETSDPISPETPAADRTLDLPNARQPLEGLLTGGQPEPAALEQAAEAGYAMVINLRSEEEMESLDEAAEVERLGMEYVFIPVAGPDGLTRAHVDALDAALERAGDAPVLIHCASGNRVGALLALRAHWLQGKSADEALQLGLDAGLTRLQPVVEEMLRESETGEE